MARIGRGQPIQPARSRVIASQSANTVADALATFSLAAGGSATSSETGAGSATVVLQSSVTSSAASSAVAATPLAPSCTGLALAQLAGSGRAQHAFGTPATASVRENAAGFAMLIFTSFGAITSTLVVLAKSPTVVDLQPSRTSVELAPSRSSVTLAASRTSATLAPSRTSATPT